MIPTALALLLLPALADAGGACLPDAGGYLTARLRGEIDLEIDWRGPALECTGMARPDGRGLRLRFAGTLPDGSRLAFVFAPPELAEGEGGRGVDVNVTIIDETGERLWGTRGAGRCTLDEVTQTRLPDDAAGRRAWAVRARGFCIEPARAVAGPGAVLLTRFDFEGQVSYRDEPGDANGGTGGARPLVAGSHPR